MLFPSLSCIILFSSPSLCTTVNIGGVVSPLSAYSSPFSSSLIIVIVLNAAVCGHPQGRCSQTVNECYRVCHRNVKVSPPSLFVAVGTTITITRQQHLLGCVERERENACGNE